MSCGLDHVAGGLLVICETAERNSKPGLFGVTRRDKQENEAFRSILEDLHKASAALDYLRSCAATPGCATSSNVAEFNRLANELQAEIDRRVDEDRVRIEDRLERRRRDAETEKKMRPANDR